MGRVQDFERCPWALRRGLLLQALSHQAHLRSSEGLTPTMLCVYRLWTEHVSFLFVVFILFVFRAAYVSTDTHSEQLLSSRKVLFKDLAFLCWFLRAQQRAGKGGWGSLFSIWIWFMWGGVWVIGGDVSLLKNMYSESWLQLSYKKFFLPSFFPLFMGSAHPSAALPLLQWQQIVK